MTDTRRDSTAAPPNISETRETRSTRRAANASSENRILNTSSIVNHFLAGEYRTTRRANADERPNREKSRGKRRGGCDEGREGNF